jgi:hypothetical protein
MLGILTMLSLTALIAVGLGSIVGFGPSAAYLAFWLCSACVLLASRRVEQWLFPAEGLTGALIRTSTLAFAFIVAGEMLLGTTGTIGLVPQLVLFGAMGAASFLLPSPAPRPQVVLRRPALVLLAALAPLLAFIVATGVTQSPLTLYDSLSYHLVFPARWLLDHHLSIVPTPFSDEAQAYAPANGELFFLWLMVPFHGDVLARIGQLPFYLLGGVVLYALARLGGAPPAHAIYPALFSFFTRPIVEQAIGADVDLICWSMFLTSIYLAIIAVERDESRDWFLCGVSVGLYCGSKYVALVYAPLVLAFALRRGFRRRMVWALPGIAMFAAPWYVRNWIVAGSPIYPSSLAVAGLTLARGAYSRHAMLHSVFHSTDVRLLPAVLAHAMGANLLLLWIPAALAGGWAMLRSPRRIAALLAAAPPAMAALEWLGVPDNVDARFLLPVAIVALLPFAFAFRANRIWNACVHAAFAAGALWIVIGWRGELPFTLPWYMAGWLSLGGIVGRGYVAWFIVMELAAIALAWSLARAPIRAGAAVAIACAAACVTLTVGSERWCAPDRCRFLTPSSIFLRSDVVAAWRWVSAHTTHATIAYAGNNVPYPLFGDHLSNRVYYVNIDRHRDWRFEDYDHAHRRRRDDEPAPADRLAVPSGVLLPVENPGASQIDAVRPRYARFQGMRDAWIDNLKARKADVLFVTALSPYEIAYNWHDAGGFPVEAAWAQSNPELFTLVYENPQTQVYAVHAP